MSLYLLVKPIKDLYFISGLKKEWTQKYEDHR